MDDATALQLCLERDRLLSDPDFARSPSMCKLLRFLVDYKLSGNSVPLKSYTIATDALGRDADFDTQTDSYPRVQMGRLRRMLDNFYLRKGGENRLSLARNKYEIILEPNTKAEVEGDGLIGQSSDVSADDQPPSMPAEPDPRPPSGSPKSGQHRWRNGLIAGVGVCLLVLAIAIGGYFLWAEEKADAVDYPRVVLDLPNKEGVGQTTQLSETIGNHLVRGLNGFGNIRIFDTISDQTEGTDYMVRLRFLEAAGDRIELRLLDGTSGEILWSKEIRTEDEELLKLELDRAIVALASNYGKIAQAEMSKAEGDFSAGYPCLIQFDLYVRYRETEKLEPVRKCLQKSVERFPNDAHLLSVFAFSQNVRQEQGSREESRALGRDIARRAEALDRNSATVNFAVAQSAFLAGDCPTGLAWGKKALELNPLNSRILGYLGLYMIGCKNTVGERYAARALELDPNADLTIAAIVAFQMLKRGEAEAARELSLEYMASSPRDEPALQLTYVLSSAMLNDKEEARRAWRSLVQHFGMPENSAPRDVLSQWIISPNLIGEIMTVLDRTGMFGRAGQANNS